MGNFITYARIPSKLPDYVPETNSKPTFDPELGFKVPRKKREAKYSEEEMKAMYLHPSQRDYCGHTMADYITCLHRKYPFSILCKRELHKHHACEYDDYVLRMKEFEREKRLRIRQQQLEGTAVS